MREEHPVILFDGYCNLCSGVVRFVARHDKKGIFRFAPLQSDTGRRLLEAHHLTAITGQSFVLVENGIAYTASDAALRLAGSLPWYWKWTRIFRIIPGTWRDAVYALIARNRYRWFGRKDSCMLPGPELRSRFLP